MSGGGFAGPWGCYAPRTADSLKALSEAIELFYEKYREYPTQEFWSPELLAIEGAILNRVEPILPDPDVLNDAWGNAFVYKSPGIRRPGSYDLYSLGADGKSETDGDDPDDISNWHDPARRRKHYEKSSISGIHLILLTGMGVAVVLLAKARRRMQLT